MPELPEVEVTRRGLAPRISGRTISGVVVREPRMRWPVPRGLQRLAGQRVRGVRRRGKYLLVDCGAGHLILHLGMSGSLRVLPRGEPVLKHDHFDLVLGDCVLRLRDPRRFGAVLWTAQDPQSHPLLAHLGVEPLSRSFDARRLFDLSRGARVNVKQFLMDGRRVVGVGNIYASESLFRAGISPRRAAGRLTRAECAALAREVKRTLREAIRAGGSSLRDYVGSDGAAGGFQLRTWVYDRAGQPCRRCAAPVKRIVQGQRATFYCPRCQR